MTKTIIDNNDLRYGDFATATEQQLGIWLRLLALCTTRENSGVIENCRHWTAQDWLLIAGLQTPPENCRIYLFDGDDLLICNYPTKEQDRFAQRRTSAQKGGKMNLNRKGSETSGKQNENVLQAKSESASSEENGIVLPSYEGIENGSLREIVETTIGARKPSNMQEAVGLLSPSATPETDAHAERVRLAKERAQREMRGRKP